MLICCGCAECGVMATVYISDKMCLFFLWGSHFVHADFVVGVCPRCVLSVASWPLYTFLIKYVCFSSEALILSMLILWWVCAPGVCWVWRHGQPGGCPAAQGGALRRPHARPGLQCLCPDGAAHPPPCGAHAPRPAPSNPALHPHAEGSLADQGPLSPIRTHAGGAGAPRQEGAQSALLHATRWVRSACLPLTAFTHRMRQMVTSKVHRVQGGIPPPFVDTVREKGWRVEFHPLLLIRSGRRGGGWNSTPFCWYGQGEGVEGGIPPPFVDTVREKGWRVEFHPLLLIRSGRRGGGWNSTPFCWYGQGEGVEGGLACCLQI